MTMIRSPLLENDHDLKKKKAKDVSADANAYAVAIGAERYAAMVAAEAAANSHWKQWQP